MRKSVSERSHRPKGPAVVAKAGTPAQPGPLPATKESQSQAQSYTGWHGCREETQIPESFLRQSVPIKVRVTVGKLKQTKQNKTK